MSVCAWASITENRFDCNDEEKDIRQPMHSHSISILVPLLSLDDDSSFARSTEICMMTFNIGCAISMVLIRC